MTGEPPIIPRLSIGMASRMSTRTEVLQVQLRLPVATIAKVLATIVVAWAGLRLWPELVFMMISVLLAVALHPGVTWLERKGVGRGTVIASVALTMGSACLGLAMLAFTSLAEQASRLLRDFPAIQRGIERRVPASYPLLKRVVREVFALPASPEVAAYLDRPLALGTTALSAALAISFTMILTLYLLLDGRRLYAWLIAYVPRVHRDRMAVTVEEVSAVVCAYVRGQVVTSLLFAVYVASLLSLLHVPAALPLALLAGICDVIPMAGIFVATAPAVLLALTVSPATAAIVFGLYALYHAAETYIIAPRVYGQQLRLSTLAVLLALMVGTALEGLIGAVLVLPLVAAYPIIERIWLRGYLNPEVLKDHRALADLDDTERERVLLEVLQGEEHAGESGDVQLREASSGPPAGSDVAVIGPVCLDLASRVVEADEPVLVETLRHGISR